MSNVESLYVEIHEVWEKAKANYLKDLRTYEDRGDADSYSVMMFSQGQYNGLNHAREIAFKYARGNR